MEGVTAGKRVVVGWKQKKGKKRVVIKMGNMRYDVIVTGGSFAGLAVASQLRGRALLVEPYEIGQRQTSVEKTTDHSCGFVQCFSGS